MNVDNVTASGEANSPPRGRPPASRSPSPALPPPTPSAPGPRASALHKLYNDAITHLLRTCSYSNFSSCFPTPSAQVPTAVKHLHEQFTAKLGEVLRREFENILVDRNVVASLNELDRLIEDARRRKANHAADVAAGKQQPAEREAPPHTLPAKQLFLAHLAPSLAVSAERMAARQDALSIENQQLMEQIKQQRKDIQALVDGLENVVEDLNGSVAVLMSGQPAELREQARDADEILR